LPLDFAFKSGPEFSAQVSFTSKAVMDKLNLLLLSILCTVVLCGTAVVASAQNANAVDEVLVDGKNGIAQHEVDRLIGFYEWAFETPFTAAERQRYRQLVIENFRRDAAGSRKFADTLLAVADKVQVRDAATQAKVRAVFNVESVKDLSSTNDEGSRLLLGIYERGQGGKRFAKAGEPRDQAESHEEAANSSGSNSGPAPNSLVGTWTRSDGTGGATDGTRKTKYNTGKDTTFEFRADGTMLFTVKDQTLSITQCRISETTNIPGRYAVSGGSLTMDLAPAR
jgi:hypothetical protein